MSNKGELTKAQQREVNDRHISATFSNMNNCLMFVKFLTTLQNKCSKCGENVIYHHLYEKCGKIIIKGECDACDEENISIKIKFNAKFLLNYKGLQTMDPYDTINTIISKTEYKLTIENKTLK